MIPGKYLVPFSLLGRRIKDEGVHLVFNPFVQTIGLNTINNPSPPTPLPMGERGEHHCYSCSLGELWLHWKRLRVWHLFYLANIMKYIASLLLACFSTVCLQAQDVIAQGQISFLELGFNNTNVNNPFWIVQINDESTQTVYDATFNSSLGRFVFDAPGGATFLVGGPQHLFTRPVPTSWSFVGVGPNQLFRATPQNGDPVTRLIMGVASFSVPNDVLVNNQFTITMSVAGITNPGAFSYYSNDDPFNSALGNLGTILLSTDQNITSFTRFAGTQNNFNMAFSAPGIYDIDFRISGTRTEAAGGGEIISPFYRYTFEIATFAVPEPTTWALMIGSSVVAASVVWQRRRRRQRALDEVIG